MDGYTLPHGSHDASEGARRIGPYVVERELGEGGMGAVYLAKRADQQFEKKVAIKLIRPGPGSQALIQRFYAERQILAGMVHPNIVRLLDGGITELGQPYLVMDYVDGTPLDKYCDEHRLTIRQRLELLRKICAAVYYAHQSLVVHRDLKPGNILVTGDGEPKLLDFGIAKVLQPSPSGLEPPATVGLFFTPLYTSPEILRGQRTTVSTDVYTLGVILYELLTGRLPHQEFRESPISVIINAIMTIDPRLPSASVTQALPQEATPEAVAASRAESPEHLKRLLRGDLDGIVMKALAKSVVERYGSVEQLSNDIDRYLERRPVQARQQTATYLARKFVRRHWRGLAASTAALLVVGFAATYSLSQQFQAAQRFEETRAIAKYLLFDLFDQISRLPGSTEVRVRMAQRAQSELDRLSSLRSSREIRLEAASGYNRLAEAYGVPGSSNLGDTPSALGSLKRAESILDGLRKERPTESGPAIERARNFLLQAKIQMWSNGRTAAAQPLIEEAARELERAPVVTDPAWLRARALLRVQQADLADFQERWVEEGKFARQGLDELSAWPAFMQQDEQYAVLRARLLRQTGNSVFYQDRVEEALKAYREAGSLLYAANRRWPNGSAVLLALMQTGYDIGTTLDKLHRTEETAQSFQSAIEAGRKLIELDERDQNLHRNYFTLLQASAQVLTETGRFEEAVREQELVVRERELRVKAQPGVTGPARDLAFSMFVLGEVHSASRNQVRACELWQSALGRFEALRKAGGITEWDWNRNVDTLRRHLTDCPHR